jgi:hypothetical protein
MGTDYTNGWDVCVATSFKNVNTILAYAYNHNVLPQKGSGQFPVPLGLVTVTADVTASVAPWTMTGGTGQNVVLNVPFTSGTAAIGTKTYALAGVSLKVTVLLRFIKSTLSSGAAGYKLVLNLTDPSAVVAVSLVNPPPNMTSDEQAALTVALRNLLQTALAGKGLSVAEVDLSQVAGSYPWLIPSRGIDYAAGSNSAGAGALGVLLATINPPPAVPPTLVAGTLPSGCDGALILSNQIFTQQFLAPAFASSLNVPTSRLTYGGANPMTAMLSGSASVSGATINQAQASVSNGGVALSLQGGKSPFDGVSVSFSINATYALSLGGTPQNPVLSFTRTSQSENHSTDIAWWVYLVSGLTGGAIAIAVVALIQAVINDAAGTTLSGTLPSGFTNSIAWPFSGTVAITQALLPTPLQLGGVVAAD